MVATAGTTIDPRQIQGIKRLRHLLPLLAPLHDVGCARDTAGNRELHLDEYVTLVLLYLMNPLIDSVRALQHAAAIDKVSEQLRVKRFSLGSFSESVRSFDPQKLKEVIAQLSGGLKPVNVDPRLKTHLDHAFTIRRRHRVGCDRQRDRGDVAAVQRWQRQARLEASRSLRL